jgi:hypothetical protein
MNKLIFVGFLAGIVLVTGIFTAEARPEYAQKEGKDCGYCHLNAGGGGARGFRGMFYGANNLSFDKFNEDRESMIAAVAANADAGDTRAKVNYVGNISGPADKQVQLIAIRRPVLVVFFDAASDDAKTSAKLLRKIALAYSNSVGVVGIAEGDTDKALKLTKDLGSQLRILPDPEGVAMKKFSATQGLDIVAVSKMGETTKLFSGVSKGNLTAAIAQIGSFGVEAPTVDLADAPADALHGGKLSG